MKRQKQLRKIHIDGSDYYWLVQRLNPHYVLLKVWFAQSGKNSQYIQVRVRFDDPWLNYGPLITAPVEKVQEVFRLRPITPAIVRQIIQAVLKQGWQVGEKGVPLNFTWDDQKGLLPATDVE